MKKGVSDVVATVIIIALVIVAISVVWLGVMPLIRNSVVEFFWVCEALGQDAKEIYGKLADEFRKISG